MSKLLHQVRQLVRDHAPLLEAVASPGLFGGQAGCALLHATLYELTGEEADGDKLAESLQRLMNQLPDIQNGTLTYGLAGVGWLMQHLVNRNLLDVDLTDIDEWVLQSIDSDRINQNAELMTGLAGKGVYFLERGEAGREGLRQVVAAIAACAEAVPGGLAWRYVTPNAEAPAYSLGLSHGVPGIICLLAKAHHQRTQPDQTQPLLESGVAWLLHQRLADAPSGTAQFPAYVGEQHGTRLAWCYGDLGVAVALWHAAWALHRPDWQQLATRLAEGAARRRLPASGVRCSDEYVDSGFCHGTAGLAHLFHRLHQVMGSPSLRRASRYWLRQTQRAAIRSEAGHFSFLTYGITDYTPRPDAPLPMAWYTEAGLLEGITGVASVLLTLAHPETPVWDSFLMTDLQPIH